MESKIVKCIDCGGEFPRKNLNRNFRCRDCAWAACWEVVHQLHEHRGSHYEKWKQSMKAVAGKL